MGKKRSIGFCLKAGLISVGDVLKLDGGNTIVVKKIADNEISSASGMKFDLTTKIYPPEPKPVVSEDIVTSPEITVTFSANVTFEYTVNANDIQSGLDKVLSMSKWKLVQESTVVDYEPDSISIDGVVKN
jgi:hypothetical protein